MVNPFKGGLGKIPLSRGGALTEAVSGKGLSQAQKTAMGYGSAALGAAAAASSVLNADSNGVGTGVAVVPDGNGPATAADLLNVWKNMSSDKDGSSVEFLKAPLNAAITGWLQSNAQVVNDFFAITGMQPTDMIDKIVSGFRNWRGGSHISNVNDQMLSIIETNKERAALKSDEHEFKAGYESRVRDTLGGPDQWENLATGVAILELAADSLPGGIQSLLAIREALEMEKGFFNTVFERRYGYSPEEWTARQLDNLQSRMYVGIR